MKQIQIFGLFLYSPKVRIFLNFFKCPFKEICGGDCMSTKKKNLKEVSNYKFHITYPCMSMRNFAPLLTYKLENTCLNAKCKQKAVD
jgi:hypothetical protein